MNNLLEICHSNAVSLYWDYENVRLPRGAKDIYTFGQSFGRIQTANVYAQWQREHNPSQVILYERGFRLIHIPVNIKNGVDNQLISDCRSEFTSHTSSSVLILLAGDKDYVPLVKELQTKGVRVIIIANRHNVSRKLLGLVHENDVYFVDRLFALAA